MSRFALLTCLLIAGCNFSQPDREFMERARLKEIGAQMPRPPIELYHKDTAFVMGGCGDDSRQAVAPPAMICLGDCEIILLEADCSAFVQAKEAHGKDR